MIYLTELLPLRERNNNPASRIGSSTASEDFLKALLVHGKSDITMLLSRDQIEWARRCYTDLPLGGSLSFQPYEATGSILEASEPSPGLSTFHRFSLDIKPALFLRSKFARRNIPVTGLVHGLSPTYLHWDVFSWLWLCDLQPFDAILCSSLAAQRAFEQQAGHIREGLLRLGVPLPGATIRTEVVPLSVDTDILFPRDKAQSRELLGLPQAKRILLVFGRISYSSKANLEPFFEVVRRLNEVHSDIEVLIAGVAQESELAVVRGSVQRYGLGNVTFRTDIANGQVAHYFCAADITVCLSDTLQESFGLTPIESMACGTPVVAPDWSGYSESIVHGESGFKVKTYWSSSDRYINEFSLMRNWAEDHLLLGSSVAFDLEEMYGYLDLLIGDPDLRRQQGEFARSHACAKYSLARLASDYQSVRQELGEVASSLPFAPPDPRRYDVLTPNYFESFQHFATNLLRAETLMCSVGKARDSVGSSFLPYIPYINLGFAVMMLDCIEGMPSGEMSLSALAQHFEEGSLMDEAMVVYHASALLKFGFLRVVCL